MRPFRICYPGFALLKMGAKSKQVRGNLQESPRRKKGAGDNVSDRFAAHLPGNNLGNISCQFGYLAFITSLNHYPDKGLSA